MFETNSQDRVGRVNARNSAWIVCLVVGIAGLISCLLLPDGTIRNAVYVAFGLLGAAAILAGVRMNRPGFALPWYALLTGQVMLVLGEATRNGVLPDFGFASLANAVALVAHVALAAALALIVRRHAKGRDIGTLLDATILAVGTGLAAWVCFLEPYVYDLSTSPTGRLIPIVGVLYVAGFAWLGVAPGRRPLPLLFVGAGLLLVLVGDALHATAQEVSYYAGQPTGYACPAAYVLWGAAALNPAMSALTGPGDRAASRFAGRGVGLLAGTLLLVPTMLFVQYLRGEPVDVPMIAGGSVVLFALSLARLNGLARGTASAAEDLEQANRREEVLGASAAALAAAADRQAVYDAALDAAMSLLALDTLENASVRIASGSADSLTVVAASEAPSGARLNVPPLVSKALLRRRSISVKQATYPGLAETANPIAPDAEHYFVPIITGRKMGGVILASTSPAAGRRSKEEIESLGLQVAAALERIERTEEEHRRRSEERFESLTRNISDGVAILEKGGAIRYASPSYAKALGRVPKDFVDAEVFASVHPDDAARLRESLKEVAAAPGASQRLGLRMRHADGSWRQMEVVANNLLDDPGVRGIVVNSRDLTVRKQVEEQLSHQTFHDPLTGLPNRDLLMDRLGQALARTGRREDSVAVLFLDLDRFKVVNDSLGHEAGDRLLVSVSKRIKASLRPEDTVARLSGDEFVILLEDVESLSQVIFLAESLVKLFEAPFMPGDQEAYTTISAGIALSGSAQDRPTDLLRNADIAMHRAKSKGKSRYEVFDAEMGVHALRRLERDTDLRRAIERQEFVVHYQPKIHLASGRLHGFEALVRWQHPQRGLVPPGQFVPLAEESGLIVRIGHWVLEESCRRAKVWRERYPSDAPAVGVNLSARQFRHPNLAELVAAALEETGLAPDALLLEITESAMMEDAEASSAKLVDLKDLGVRIAIDDFGTGYSSLAYLKRFPLDMLKIDRSFVNELGKDAKGAAIIEAVRALGQTLQMQVLAEGVETAEQAEMLRDLGCELGQGYYFAKPMPQDEAEALISRHLGAGIRSSP